VGSDRSEEHRNATRSGDAQEHGIRPQNHRGFSSGHCGTTNCIDIGAHKGEVLADIIKFAPAGKHIAIKALPELASRLRKRFPRADVHEMALSDQQCEAQFMVVG